MIMFRQHKRKQKFKLELRLAKIAIEMYIDQSEFPIEEHVKISCPQSCQINKNSILNDNSKINASSFIAKLASCTACGKERDFERNMFFVEPDSEPITTDEPPEKVLDWLEDLGQGVSGQVVKMRHTPTGKICAVKQMRRIGDEEDRRIFNDLKVILSCKYENIVSSCGYFITSSEVWICMEIMSISFDRLLKLRNNPLPEHVLGVMAGSTLKALAYLKDKLNYIHRDIKPSNILISEDGKIKICDFGISGQLYNSRARSRGVGCIQYMAPERFDINRDHYDIRSDVWSLGITLYELATNSMPYSGSSEFEVSSTILYKEPPRLPKEGNFSEAFHDFIALCLTKNDEERPKCFELIDHPFITSHVHASVRLNELL